MAQAIFVAGLAATPALDRLAYSNLNFLEGGCAVITGT
jgi:hypothetical protein